MIQGVAQAAAHLLAHRGDAELGHGPGQGFPVTPQAEEGRVEPGDVLAQAGRAVPLRVQGDEQHLQPLPLLPQGLPHRGEAGQGGGADIGAGGVAEEEDHHPAAEVRQTPWLAALVRQGRLAFLSQFRRLALPEVRERLANPGGEDVFLSCKLDAADRTRNRQWLDLHRDLIRLRRGEPPLALAEGAELDGAVIGPEAFVLRYPGRRADGGTDRDRDLLLAVNLGRDLNLTVAPEPLLAPPPGRRWEILWSSEEPRYGGGGTPPLENLSADNWRLPGGSAVLLAPVPEAPVPKNSLPKASVPKPSAPKAPTPEAPVPEDHS